MNSKTFAFVHVRVTPIDEARVLFDQTVVVQNGRIHQIADSANTTIPTPTSAQKGIQAHRARSPARVPKRSIQSRAFCLSNP